MSIENWWNKNGWKPKCPSKTDEIKTDEIQNVHANWWKIDEINMNYQTRVQPVARHSHQQPPFKTDRNNQKKCKGTSNMNFLLQNNPPRLLCTYILSEHSEKLVKVLRTHPFLFGKNGALLNTTTPIVTRKISVHSDLHTVTKKWNIAVGFWWSGVWSLT